MTGKRKTRKKDPESYQKRSYRNLIDSGALVSFEVRVRETDLHILAEKDLSEQATHSVHQYRAQLESYISRHPKFLKALVPIPPDPLAPAIVKEMIKAGSDAGVGPMAAVAGTLAEFVGRDLLALETGEVMVENGGDIFLSRKKKSLISIFAGASPLSCRTGIAVPPEKTPIGICTSSGTVGHSLSLGKADSVTVVSRSTALADAAATRLGNVIQTGGDIDKALGVARAIQGIMSVVIILDTKMGVWGELELVKI